MLCLETERVLICLVANETVLGAKDLTTAWKGAQVWVARSVHLGVLYQIELATEGLATVGPFTAKSTTRVYVSVGVKVLLLAESLATVLPVTVVRLLGVNAAVTVTIVVAVA